MVQQSNTLFLRGSSHGVVRVLVTGVGGNVGQGILKALAASGLASWVVGTDADPGSVGLFLVDRGYVVPRADDLRCRDVFCDIICREKVDIVFVGADKEIVHVARMKRHLETETGARVVISEPAVVDCCIDKWETARWFARMGFDNPRTVLSSDREGIRRLAAQVGYPLLVKPRTGFASRGIWLLERDNDIAACVDRHAEGAVVQEIVGSEGEEFTAATFSSCPGKVDALIIMRRILLQGTSYRIEPIREAAMESAIRRWGEAMGGLGPLNFQFRRVNNVPVCFEVNPRFSGTVGVRFRFGYNDIAMAIRFFCLGEKIVQPQISCGVVLRYWEELLLQDVTGDGLRRLTAVQEGVPMYSADAQ